jgi:hypothetical protein
MKEHEKRRLSISTKKQKQIQRFSERTTLTALAGAGAAFLTGAGAAFLTGAGAAFLATTTFLATAFTTGAFLAGAGFAAGAAFFTATTFAAGAFLTATFATGAFFPTARVAKRGWLKAVAEAKSKARTAAVFMVDTFLSSKMPQCRGTVALDVARGAACVVEN